MHTLRKLPGDCRRACGKIWDFRSLACVADAESTLWRRCKRAGSNGTNWMKIARVYRRSLWTWRASWRDHSGLAFTYTGEVQIPHGRRETHAAYILRVSPVLDCARSQDGMRAAIPRR